MKRKAGDISKFEKGGIGKFVSSLQKNKKAQALILLVAVLIIGGVYFMLTPKRNTESFCGEYKSSVSSLSEKYKKMVADKKSDEELSKSLRKDLKDTMERLSARAPSDISTHIDSLHDMLKDNTNDNFVNASSLNTTNPLSSLFGTNFNGLTNMMAFYSDAEVVDSYVVNTCKVDSFMGGSSASNSSSSDTSKTSSHLTAEDVKATKDNSLNLWDGKFHGILAVTSEKSGNSIFGIDPVKKVVTGKVTVPTSGRTEGGDTGRSYDVTFSSAGSYRYYPLSFRVDDSHPKVEFGYYDLKERKAVPIGLYEGGVFDGEVLNHIKMYSSSIGIDDTGNKIRLGNIYKSDTKTAMNVFYNIPTKKTEYVAYEKDDKYINKPDTVRSFDNKKTITLWNPDSDVKYLMDGKYYDSFPCTPMTMTSQTHVLCKDLNSSGLTDKYSVYTVDIASIINDKKEKDDANSADYQVGRLHYNVPIVKDSLITEGVYSVIPSADKKQIAVNQRKGDSPYGIYVISLSDKVSSTIYTEVNPYFADLKLLDWK